MKGQDVPYISAGAGFSVPSTLANHAGTVTLPMLLIWLVHSCLVSQLTSESHRKGHPSPVQDKSGIPNSCCSYLGPRNLFPDTPDTCTDPGTLNWSLRWEVPLRLHREPLKPSPPKPLQLSMYLRNFRNLQYLHTSISVPNHTIQSVKAFRPRPPRNLRSLISFFPHPFPP